MATLRIRQNHIRMRRAHRTHERIIGSAERPRLTVFRSNRGISVQLIDDGKGVTLVHASSREVSAEGGSVSRGKGKENKSQVAEKVGTLIAKRATEAGIVKAVFDRGSYRYHGRVKALAEAARAGGLTL